MGWGWEVGGGRRPGGEIWSLCLRIHNSLYFSRAFCCSVNFQCIRMIFGVGTDIIEVQRVGALVAKGPFFMERIFTAAEVAYCESKRHKNQHFAARFAAKEAFMKALGTGWSRGIGFNQIEVRHLESGQPEIFLHGKALEYSEEMGILRMHLSLTHIKEYAIATVILEQ